MTGVITTIAGGSSAGSSGDGGAATSALLNSPRGLYVDSSGNVYFADSSNHRIRKVSIIQHTLQCRSLYLISNGPFVN